jgi:hypothetical protein
METKVVFSPSMSYFVFADSSSSNIGKLMLTEQELKALFSDWLKQRARYCRMCKIIDPSMA